MAISKVTCHIAYLNKHMIMKYWIFQLLELPYVGEDASMVIVLPQEIEGLNDVMAKLAAGYDLLTDIENMYKTKVQVTLPKFKIETTIDLNELLPKVCSLFFYNTSFITSQNKIKSLFLFSSGSAPYLIWKIQVLLSYWIVTSCCMCPRLYKKHLLKSMKKELRLQQPPVSWYVTFTSK